MTPADSTVPVLRVDNDTGTLFFDQPKERAIYRVLLDFAVDGIQPVLLFKDLESTGEEEFGWGTAIWTVAPDPEKSCMSPQGSGYFQETGVTSAATFGGSTFQLHPPKPAGLHEAWIWGWGFNGTLGLRFSNSDNNVTLTSQLAPWLLPAVTSHSFEQSEVGAIDLDDAAYAQVTSQVTRAFGDEASWRRDLVVRSATEACGEFHDAGSGQLLGGDTPENAVFVSGGILGLLEYDVALSDATLPIALGSNVIDVLVITFTPIRPVDP